MSEDWVGRATALKFRAGSFVDGVWQEGRGEIISKVSPRDGALLYRFRAATGEDVSEAVASAKRAFRDGRWSALPVDRRKAILISLAALIERHGDEFALLECLDVGKPVSSALNVDVPMAAAVVRWSAEAMDKLSPKVYSAGRSNLSYELLRPIGVVAGIIGWNFPLVLAAQKIGPALAAGNCLILKCSELTSLSAMRLAELAVEAGVPEAVFTVLGGGPEVGSALAHHHDVDLLTFTGSSQTGKKLFAAAGASNMKRLLLECGGKGANIVFEDCPELDDVAQSIVERAFWNQGEVCSASSRLLVHEDIKKDLLERVIQKSSKLSPGDPLDPKTEFGALVSATHKQKVLGYITCGQQEGARIVHQTSFQEPFSGGFYVPPTIFDGVLSDNRIAQEEIFGPVLSVLTFKTEREAVEMANGTIYGLTAIAWTKDLGRAHRVSHTINAGLTVINATTAPAENPNPVVLAVGGHKQSGVGVEGGLDGIKEYLTKTAVQFVV